MAHFGSFFDGELSRQERACLGSFVRHGHEVTVFSYDRLDLPSGVAQRAAADILAQDRLYRADTGAHKGTVAQFANHFRYVMIRDTGLIWIDSDVICLSPTWPEREWIVAWQDRCLVNNAVLRFPPDHPALARAIAVAERLSGLTVWGLTGPHLLTALIADYELHEEVLPADCFYPVHHSKAVHLLHELKPGENLELPDSALCVHLWNEVLRKAGHDRHKGPLPNSALARLLDYAESV